MKRLIQRGLAKFGYTIRRLSTLHGDAPGSATRPVGDFNLFLEDILARGFVPKGIIDVGANSGEWTKLALSIFPKTPVLMIEPQDEMEPFLSDIMKTAPNCRWIKAGAGREAGELVQTIWDDFAGSSFLPATNAELMKTRKQRSTPIVTIDVALPKFYPELIPDLVKIDIQGFELEALSGGEKLFGKTEVFILEAPLFSVIPPQPIAREIIAFMFARGYELYDIPGFVRRPYDGALGQLDLAFVKAKGFFRKVTNWSDA